MTTTKDDEDNINLKILDTPLLSDFSDSELEEMELLDQAPIADASEVGIEERIDNSLEELPDKNIATFNQKAKFLAEKKLRKELEMRIKISNQQEVNRFLYEHPEASDLNYITKGRAISAKYSDLNYKVIYEGILSCILDRRNVLTTQKAILDSVKTQTGITALTASIWSNKLPNFMFGVINKRLMGNGITLSLAGCVTLSDVRKAIEAHFAKLKAVHKAKLNVSISDEFLTVNGTSYKIHLVKAGNSEYKSIRVAVNNKREWLRVDSLKTLFGM